ncbi:MAG: hypothetical protein U9O98_09015, partial [Asgard group archaeon]|nr:hypothetical protein [Asgard group archaeon]
NIIELNSNYLINKHFCLMVNKQDRFYLVSDGKTVFFSNIKKKKKSSRTIANSTTNSNFSIKK